MAVRSWKGTESSPAGSVRVKVKVCFISCLGQRLADRLCSRLWVRVRLWMQSHFRGRTFLRRLCSPLGYSLDLSLTLPPFLPLSWGNDDRYTPGLQISSIGHYCWHTYAHTHSKKEKDGGNKKPAALQNHWWMMAPGMIFQLEWYPNAFFNGENAFCYCCFPPADTWWLNLFHLPLYNIPGK